MKKINFKGVGHDTLMSIFFNGVDKKIYELEYQLTIEQDRAVRRAIYKEILELQEIQMNRKKFNITPTDLLKAGLSLVSLAAVLKHEETNIITTKMWSKVIGMFK